MRLDVQSVTVSRGGGPVLRSLDLSVRHGEVIALVGRNGAGKTTLLETIAGLLRPSSGSIEIDGHPISGAKPHAVARKGIALAPEGRKLFPNMTVEENLAMGAHATRWWWGGPGEEAFAGVWDLFPPLFEFRGRRVGALSGGQQQMVTIGRALMSSPELLMLDEPTFGLSPQLTESMCSHLGGFRSAGFSVLLAEQNLDVALDVAPRIALLDEGRVVAVETPDRFVGMPLYMEAMFGGLDEHEGARTETM